VLRAISVICAVLLRSIACSSASSNDSLDPTVGCVRRCKKQYFRKRLEYTPQADDVKLRCLPSRKTTWSSGGFQGFFFLAVLP